MELAQKKCTTYKAGAPPITRKDVMELLGMVPGWSLVNGHLARKYEIEGSERCTTFFNDIMTLAAQEGHYPDICITESRHVEVSFYTYPAGGLTLNDFIMAAKLNEMEITE
jgi:4a-hydroxytetrahydrobiopterin dehydratase